MSVEEEVNIRIKKWMVGSIIAVSLAVLTAIGTCMSFYYNTNSTIDELKKELVDVKETSLRDMKESIVRHDIILQNKVSVEEMRDFKSDMKSDMDDIKKMLNILLEKR